MRVYVRTLVMVSEYRNGYDGLPLSADALPSSSAGSESSELVMAVRRGMRWLGLGLVLGEEVRAITPRVRCKQRGRCAGDF